MSVSASAKISSPILLVPPLSPVLTPVSENTGVFNYLWNLIPPIFSSSASHEPISDKEFVLVQQEPLIEIPGLNGDRLVRVLQYIQLHISRQTVERQREVAKDYPRYLTSLSLHMGGTELASDVKIFADFIADKIKDDKEIFTKLLEVAKKNPDLMSKLPSGLSMEDFIKFSTMVSEKAIKLGKTDRKDILDILEQIESEGTEGISIEPSLKIYISFIRQLMNDHESTETRKKELRQEGKRSPTSSMNLDDKRTSDSSDDSSKNSLNADDIFTVTIMDLLTKEERSFDADEQEAVELRDLKMSSFAGFLFSSFFPIRTNICQSLCTDLFFPVTINFAANIKDPIAKIFACIFAFIWDIITLVFRFLLLIPRLIYNACRPVHPITQIFIRQDFPKGFGSEIVKISVNIKDTNEATKYANLIGERLINLVPIPKSTSAN